MHPINTPIFDKAERLLLLNIREPGVKASYVSQKKQHTTPHSYPTEFRKHSLREGQSVPQFPQQPTQKELPVWNEEPPTRAPGCICLLPGWKPHGNDLWPVHGADVHSRSVHGADDVHPTSTADTWTVGQKTLDAH